jgi:hypothetical protein
VRSVVASTRSRALCCTNGARVEVAGTIIGVCSDIHIFSVTINAAVDTSNTAAIVFVGLEIEIESVEVHAAPDGQVVQIQ